MRELTKNLQLSALAGKPGGERQAARARADVRAEPAKLKRARRMPRKRVGGNWVVPVPAAASEARLSSCIRAIDHQSAKRRGAQAAATSAAAMTAEAACLPAETDTMSPAQTNKRLGMPHPRLGPPRDCASSSTWPLLLWCARCGRHQKHSKVRWPSGICKTDQGG